MSQLSFGAGVRPPVGDGVPYDGRNGVLPAGVYYVAIAAYPTTFGSSEWDVRSTGAQSGTVALRIASNLAPCYANCDGSTQPPILNILDFACFQSRFAQGCP